MGKTFTLWATILSWADADTARGYLSLGFDCYLGSIGHPIRMRSALIQAPELKTPEGIAALRFVEQLVPPGEYPVISYKPDNYGRPLVDYMLPGNWLFSQALLQAGHARPYKR